MENINFNITKAEEIVNNLKDGKYQAKYMSDPCSWGIVIPVASLYNSKFSLDTISMLISKENNVFFLNAKRLRGLLNDNIDDCIVLGYNNSSGYEDKFLISYHPCKNGKGDTNYRGYEHISYKSMFNIIYLLISYNVQFKLKAQYID
ncbi:Hypothetical protein ORPV_72 [Orpheovirus IHUMI-LCC2]|uniref:Uncharacterized protein n=1 Tax=Orpheovirus IHUMI-LCC2 TaxID=2023057 RepID=A0A2I2L370_9VIRU|nr:Hypothetical protein ORPV_72 [Orpheovirus IHUMI-LCC2]SNW61976.1 Hypothetical protein ORPV_72 [Orpheovirus IHUMI-LCC2]